MGLANENQKRISVNFISLGCPKNLVDSEVMIGLLDKDDFEIRQPHEPSHVSVINTCSFVDEAKQESIDTILEVAHKKQNGDTGMIVVAGCMAQRYFEELPDLLPEVDMFVGTGEYHNLPGLIRHKLAGQAKIAYVEKPEFVPEHLTPRIQSTPFYTKYVKVSEGCSHKCSFCIIPFMRGTLRSRQPDDIYNEIKEGAEKGIKEFNIVAQDLNEYGRDLEERSSLFKMLESLKDIDGDIWVRLMYMYPLQFPDKLVRLIEDHPHILPYVDIPLQHISDRMLKKMNRGSSSRYIHRLIDNLKTIPNMVIRTTFIVGHPGETEEDFQELKQFIIDSEFDRVGIFKYSQEEGTPAFDMNGQVDEDTKEERFNELMSIQKEISLKRNQRLVGQTIDVIMEGESDETELLLQGRYYGQAPGIDGVVLINEGSAAIGDMVKVEIIDAFEYDLLGRIVS